MHAQITGLTQETKGPACPSGEAIEFYWAGGGGSQNAFSGGHLVMNFVVVAGVVTISWFGQSTATALGS
jgi:hypothetical protein